jgi:hypothetical protein
MIVGCVLAILQIPYDLANLADPRVKALLIPGPIPILISFWIECAGYCLQIVSAVAMLKGRNWGRALFFSWKLTIFFAPRAGFATPLWATLLVDSGFIFIAHFLIRPKANLFFAGRPGQLDSPKALRTTEETALAVVGETNENPYRSPASECLVRGSLPSERPPFTLHRYIIVFSLALLPGFLLAVSLYDSPRGLASIRAYYFVLYIAIFWANGNVFRSDRGGIHDWLERGMLSTVVLVACQLVLTLLAAVWSGIHRL